MSGSITDSDAGAQDWDVTWSEPKGTAYSDDYKFIWTSPWKNLRIKVWLPNNEIQEQVTSCIMPVKIQFLVNLHEQCVYKAIRNIQEIQVKSVYASDELLEIRLMSCDVDDIISVIENKLTNDFDDIVVKVIQQFKFTPSLAEEQFRETMTVKNVHLTCDDRKIYIVGFSTMKVFIDHTISQINKRSLKRIERIKEKWKMAAVQIFSLTKMLSMKFNDLIICSQDNFASITFHGRESKVKDAIKELNSLIENLHVVKLHLDPLLIKLLICKSASDIFTELLKQKQANVVWTIEDEHICIFSNVKVETETIRSLLYENFLVVGFSKPVDCCRAFCTSKVFSDCIKTHSGTLLIQEDSNHGVNIASTKYIGQDLICKEMTYHAKPENDKCVQGKVDQ